jgi:hypothetical protein
MKFTVKLNGEICEEKTIECENILRAIDICKQYNRKAKKGNVYSLEYEGKNIPLDGTLPFIDEMRKEYNNKPRKVYTKKELSEGLDNGTFAILSLDKDGDPIIVLREKGLIYPFDK